jgi:hypothetical protein
LEILNLLRFASLFVAILTISSSVIAAPLNYGNNLVAPADASKDLKLAVADADATLEKMTGQTFKVTSEYSVPGVLLLRSSEAQAPADARAKLKNKSGASFIMRSDGANVLQIISNTDAGLSHGLYTFLEKLGARWLLPNPNWTIIPEKKDITMKMDLLEVPDYRFRQFGGSGGFGRSFPYDPGEAERNRARWENWQRRLRLGSESKLGGHSYHGVYLRNKKVFDEHPEYLALVDGKRMSTEHDNVKFDVSQRGLVDLYVKDRIEEFRRERAKDPNYSAVSVDPSDGYSHCNTGPCMEIGNGSPSDQVFYLANETAKALRKEFANGYVSLYAYNQHANLPSFDLEPNIYVMIIPYAFQNTGLKPQELIEAWHAKVPRMGIYDYWGMPSWSLDMPSFNYLSTPSQRLRLWHQNGVDGFVNESSYSAGAMGLAWYLSSKLMWDVSQPVEPILDDWYQHAYGPARAPMQRMMERWATNFALNSGEIATSLSDLNQARALAKGHPDILARLMDMGRYINYMRLHLERDATADELREAQKSKDEKLLAAATKARDEAALRLQKYLWNIYDSSMIHAFRLNQITKSPSEIKARYRQGQKDAPGWSEITPLTDADVAAMIDEQTRNYPLLGFEIRNYSGEWQPVPASAIGKNLAPADGYSLPMYTGGDAGRPGTFDVIALPELKTLRLKAQLRTRGTILLRGADGRVVQEKIVERTVPETEQFFEEREVEFPIPAPGRYQIVIEGLGLRVPPGVPILLQGNNYVNSQYLYGRLPYQYFYVPKGLKRIAVDIPYDLKPTFYNPAGEQVKPIIKDAGKLFLVDVPAGQDEKIWSVKDLVSPKGIQAKMLNVPRIFSFHPEMLYVPADALQPVM